MKSLKALEKIREFIEHSDQLQKITTTYKSRYENTDYFKDVGIRVELDNCKEIILTEETKMEFGGVSNNSFSLAFPMKESYNIHDGRIILIGPEIKDISDKSIDFGLMILIGYNNSLEYNFDELRHFNFISNGIEGFMIRTIPRRFWCRISEKILPKFSFEFLGNAIMFLYKNKFRDIIKSMEIIFISKNSDILEEIKNKANDIRIDIESKWKDKVEKWKKKIDCDYDWDCNICPYFDTCEDVRDVLEERNKIKD